MVNNEIEIVPSAEILENWQEITNILAELTGIRAALIMRFLDPTIEVFVSSKGEGNPYKPGDKETLFDSGLYCETVIKTQEKLLVPDALASEKWKNNPDIKLNMVSYLGFPILLPDKKLFGTLCILDNKPNQYSNTIENLMSKFRHMLESHLEILYINQILGDKNKQLNDYLMEIQTLRGFVPICANCKDIRDDQNNWRPLEYYFRNPDTKFTHSICPKCSKKLYPNIDINT